MILGPATVFHGVFCCVALLGVQYNAERNSPLLIDNDVLENVIVNAVP